MPISTTNNNLDDLLAEVIDLINERYKELSNWGQLYDVFKKVASQSSEALNFSGKQGKTTSFIGSLPKNDYHLRNFRRNFIVTKYV